VLYGAKKIPVVKNEYEQPANDQKTHYVFLFVALPSGRVLGEYPLAASASAITGIRWESNTAIIYGAYKLNTDVRLTITGEQTIMRYQPEKVTRAR
jgi:hypothetical protein